MTQKYILKGLLVSVLLTGFYTATTRADATVYTIKNDTDEVRIVQASLFMKTRDTHILCRNTHPKPAPLTLQPKSTGTITINDCCGANIAVIDKVGKYYSDRAVDGAIAILPCSDSTFHITYVDGTKNKKIQLAAE